MRGQKSTDMVNKDELSIYLAVDEGVREGIANILKSLPNHLSLSGDTDTAEYMHKKGLQIQSIKSAEKTAVAIKNRQFDIFVNIPSNDRLKERDEKHLRKLALEYGVEVMTSPDSLEVLSLIRNAKAICTKPESSKKTAKPQVAMVFNTAKKAKK